MKKNIAAIVGGISETSLNKRLYEAAIKLAPDDFNFTFVEIKHLPFFNQDLESNVPESVLTLKGLIERADAVLFVTPEYNRSFPGVIKNAIDWGSRPIGKNSWNGKPAGLMGASPGAQGTVSSQLHLRQVLMCLNMQTVAQPEFYLSAAKAFDGEGNLVDERTKDFVRAFWKSYGDLIEKFARKV